MSWYLQHLPPGVSVSAYLDSRRAAPTGPDDPPLKCSSLTDALRICWQTDWDHLTAEVELTSAEGPVARAQLTNVRPIGDLTTSGRSGKVELLAALDVLKHVIYLRGCTTSRGEPVKIGRVLD